jgi:hypothetical protein
MLKILSGRKQEATSSVRIKVDLAHLDDSIIIITGQAPCKPRLPTSAFVPGPIGFDASTNSGSRVRAKP